MNNDTNACYICFEPTDHKQSCKCRVHVCKECLIEELKHRKQCSICKTDIEINHICSENNLSLCSENNLSLYCGAFSFVCYISFILSFGIFITKNKYNNFIEVIAYGIIGWIILILTCLLLFGIYMTIGVIALNVYNYLRSKLQLFNSSLG